MRICSEIKLPELRRPEAPSTRPDLYIQVVEDVSAEDVGQVNGGGRFLGSVEGVGAFGLVEGRKILVSPEKDVEHSRLRTVLLGPIMSIALTQQGYNVLHAGSAVVGGRAVAFIGPSGIGKSTLTAAFYYQGHSTLGDDLAAVDCETFPAVQPGYPGIKLCEDAASFLREDVQALPTLHKSNSRRLERAERGFPARPVPLGGIYILDYGMPLEIKPVRQKKALASVIANTRAIPPLSHPNIREARFQHCVSLVREVPVLKLKRPDSLSSLFEVVEALKDDLQSRSAHSA